MTGMLAGLLLLSAALAGRPAYSTGERSPYTAEQIVGQVNAVYQRVTSARGRITRTFESGEHRITHTGRFAAIKPDRLFVEFVGDHHQITVVDDDRFRIYFPAFQQGIYHERSAMHPLERFMTGPEPLFGNLLQLAAAEHSLALIDTVEGNLILKMTPRTPSLFGFSLAAIDPGTWTLRAVENFSGGGDLVSQTRFLKFSVVEDSLYFPTETITTTRSGTAVSRETTRFTRVALNEVIPDETFVLPDDDAVEWLPHEALMGGGEP